MGLTALDILVLLIRRLAFDVPEFQNTTVIVVIYPVEPAAFYRIVVKIVVPLAVVRKYILGSESIAD